MSYLIWPIISLRKKELVAFLIYFCLILESILVYLQHAITNVIVAFSGQIHCFCYVWIMQIILTVKHLFCLYTYQVLSVFCNKREDFDEEF